MQKTGRIPVLSERFPKLRSLQSVSGPVYTLGILGAGFVMFITPDLETAITMYKRMFSGAEGERSVYAGWFFGAFLITMVFNLFQLRSHEIRENRIWIYYPALFLMSFLVAALLGAFAPGSEDFFYFKF